MKFSKILMFGVFAFGIAFCYEPQKSHAGITYAKESVRSVKYDTEFRAAVEIAGVEVPVGIVVTGGRKAIGTIGTCEWAFSTCDSKDNEFQALPK